MATANVAKKRTKETKKTSGTEWVTDSTKQAGPVRFQPRSRHVTSDIHIFLTMIRPRCVIQSSGNSSVQFGLHNIQTNVVLGI